MAYNNLSGTVLLPNKLIKTEGFSTGIVSGNLSTSDGADVINVPRVSLPNTDSLVINTGGDPNTLRCDTKLTFDGDTLNVVGEITASTGVSASFFMGDGSRLTGVTFDGLGGIFTEINGSSAFTTSSVTIGGNTTPAHPLSVTGISQLSGGVIHKRVAKTSNYSITTSDYIIGVDSTSGVFRLTLPAAAASPDGQTWVIKDESGQAGTNNVTITGSADSNTIDGQNFVVLESPYASIQVYSNGNNKFYIF